MDQRAAMPEAKISLIRTEKIALAGPAGPGYELMISWPAQPAPAAGYPVIYALDGNATFPLLSEIVRLQTRPPHGYDPAIVVGIGYEGVEVFGSPQRIRDFTTPAAQSELPPRPSGEPWPLNGGADALADWIETAVKPLVATRFPVDPARQTLFGHSLGGFFVLNTLYTHPESYAAFFAGSPSLWWKAHSLFERIGDFRARFDVAMAKPRLAIGFGGAEPENSVADGRALAERLRAIEGFDMRYIELEGEDHGTVLPAMMSRLAAFALAPHGRPPRKVGLKPPAYAAHSGTLQ